MTNANELFDGPIPPADPTDKNGTGDTIVRRHADRLMDAARARVDDSSESTAAARAQEFNAKLGLWCDAVSILDKGRAVPGAGSDRTGPDAEGAALPA